MDLVDICPTGSCRSDKSRTSAWILVPHRWKSVQLSILTLWNVSSRDACLERRIIESDAAVQLLDVVCNEAWPPSLRDMAGGFLSFLSERRSNLAHFPVVDLPADVKWPLAKPPTDGLVPAIAGYINLINSRCVGQVGHPTSIYYRWHRCVGSLAHFFLHFQRTFTAHVSKAMAGWALALTAAVPSILCSLTGV